jgi:hypothetical protein
MLYLLEQAKARWQVFDAALAPTTPPPPSSARVGARQAYVYGALVAFLAAAATLAES